MLLAASCPAAMASSFVNFETAPVHPIALSPDRDRLAVCNLADGKLEVFDVTSGHPIPLGSIPVGIDPVSVRYHGAHEAWVVNQISDSISIVDLTTLRITATIDTLDTPADVVFAGSPLRAFVSCAMPNTVQVFDPGTRQLLTNVVLNADRPKSLAVSPDGQKVYVGIFESGNGTTVVGARFRNLLFFDNAVSRTNGPYGGQNPPPNSSLAFNPSLNPALPTNVPAPRTSVIVRRNTLGRWLDDNQRDWTEFVSGTNASLTQRVTGWDLPDRDLAVIDAANLTVSYATGLMNACMGVGVNPVSGRIAVVGTDAINEVRFEPNLNGIFARVKVALVDPLNFTKTVKDLNPHLDYSMATVAISERERSIGDPRAIVWTSDGSRGYVAGMGSRNLVVIDSAGNRLATEPIEVGEGPSGLAIDESRQRLYVFNRFSSSISVVNTATDLVVDAVSLFDPTPIGIAAGRRHLYDTRRTSGLGQASCASCHVDARMDRLGWDLGNPAGEIISPVVNHQRTLVTNIYHPMKGVMVTQTLQDIIGHEPFHWRGDRPDIESFNSTFTNLQGAATALTPAEMREFREFLSSIRFPPNAYRQFDNSLSTNVPLPGQVALGDDLLPAGSPLPNGNALAGFAGFNLAGNFCTTCHTLPTGLGFDSAMQGGALKPVPTGPNDAHHFPVAFRLEGDLRSKISQFRNMADKVGMEGHRPQSRAGFGFGHDGSVDSLTRFLNGLRVVPDQEVADFTAFLLSVSGSDTDTPGAVGDPTPPAAVGRQLTIAAPGQPALFDAMLALARSASSRVDLIAKGSQDGLARGWWFDRVENRFQSDRRQEVLSPGELLALAAPQNALTFTVVPRGLGIRLGVDRDSDGSFDRDELDGGENAADPPAPIRIQPSSSDVAAGTDLMLATQLHPMSAPVLGIVWRKDGQTIAGDTNGSLLVTNVSFAAAGDYTVVITTAFQSYTSPPVRISVVPLLAIVSPVSQAVRRGSNALFAAATTGIGPFAYRWQFNRETLIDETGASLVVSNAQLVNEGFYQVAVGNAFGAITSAPVFLGILINPAVITSPLSQTAVIGGHATFSLTISGHPPPFGYQLRKSTVTVTNYTSHDRSGFLSLDNVQSSNAGTYRIVVTNAANPSPGLTLDPITLTILADYDADGLPDEWEAAYGFATNNAADALLDSDADGQSNLREYLAGTDPHDSESFLKVEKLFAVNGQTAAVVQFNAISNKTYTVQSRGTLIGEGWSKAADIVAVPTNRLVSVTNSLDGAGTRYYRLVTPQGP
jgi:YVTN family beta-propeller protein